MLRARLRFLLACAALVAPSVTPSRAAETKAFVACSDFSTGSLDVVNLGTRAVSRDVEPIHSDARLRFFGGELYVINRFGQDNVQVVNPATNQTVRQFSTGNGSNPYDLAFVSATRAYVTRYDRASILIVNPQTGAELGTIDLAAFADADGLPEMDHAVRVDDRVFVSLQRLNRSAGYAPTDSSLVVVIDADADTVLDADPAHAGKQAIRLAAKNPVTAFAFDAASARLLVGCAGVYGATDGAVVALDPVHLTSLGTVATEANLGGDLGDLAWWSATRSYAIVSDAAFNTKLVAWNPTTGLSLGAIASPSGFVLADVELNDRGELYLCNDDFVLGGVSVYAAATGALLAGPLPMSLPPQAVTFDAPSGIVVGAEERFPSFAFAPPSPNPARSSIAFALTLPEAGDLALEIADVAGRRVATLARGTATAGTHHFEWNLKCEGGGSAPSGVYFACAAIGRERVTRRLVVVR